MSVRKEYQMTITPIPPHTGPAPVLVPDGVGWDIVGQVADLDGAHVILFWVRYVAADSPPPEHAG